MIGPDGYVLTYPEWLRRRRRRERLLRYGGGACAIVLPALLAWVVIRWLVG